MFVSLRTPSPPHKSYYYEKRNSLPYFNWENTSKCHRILKPFFCCCLLFFFFIFSFLYISSTPLTFFTAPSSTHIHNTSLMRCLWKARTPFTILIRWTFFLSLPLHLPLFLSFFPAKNNLQRGLNFIRHSSLWFCYNIF